MENKDTELRKRTSLLIDIEDINQVSSVIDQGVETSFEFGELCPTDTKNLIPMTAILLGEPL